MNTPEHTLRVAAEIRRYLERQPGAMDTLDGIAGWWIPLQRLEEALEEVSHALAYLERKGEIARQETTDGRIFYARWERGATPAAFHLDACEGREN